MIDDDQNVDAEWDAGPAAIADFQQNQTAAGDSLRKATHGFAVFSLYREPDGSLSCEFTAALNPNDRDCLTIGETLGALDTLGTRCAEFITDRTESCAEQMGVDVDRLDDMFGEAA